MSTDLFPSEAAPELGRRGIARFQRAGTHTLTLPPSLSRVDIGYDEGNMAYDTQAKIHCMPLITMCTGLSLPLSTPFVLGRLTIFSRFNFALPAFALHQFFRH